MTSGSKNTAMGVAGSRIILFNGLLFFWFRGRRKQGKNKDGKEERDSKEGCVMLPIGNSNSKTGQVRESACIARAHQQGSMKDY